MTQLRVGRLTKAHGLKGALKLELYTDDPGRRFVPGAVFSLQVPPDSPWHGKNIELAELRWYNGHPVGFFAGVNDRSAAESLAKAILWVEQKPLDDEEPDAWYDHQLVGLTVLREGAEVGRVERVDHLPAQDLLAVSTERGEVLVPFVTAIVPIVDIAAGTVTVTPPTGLFEPSEADADEAGTSRESASRSAASTRDDADDAEPTNARATNDEPGE